MSELILSLDNLTQRYKLKLAQLNEIEIGELSIYSDFTYTRALTEISELTFTMPSVYMDEMGQTQPTPYYTELEADVLIIVEDEEYFYIDTCSESTKDGYSTKTIHAYSREYELSFKSFNNYEPETERFLYFTYPTETQIGFPWTSAIDIPASIKDHVKTTKDRDGYYYGIFTEIEQLTRWKLKRISSFNPIMPMVYSEASGVRESIKYQTRKITTSESNLLEVMKQIQEAWGVYFDYDTKNRIITIKAIEDLIEETNGDLKPAIGILSDENFILDLTKEMKNQGIKTRLYVYNSNGDGVIASLTGHGQPYLEDYSYYRNPTYMSSHLLGALSRYDTQIANAAPTTTALFNQYKTLLDERILVEEEISYLNEELARTTAQLDPLRIIKEGYKVGNEVILEPGILDATQQAEYDALAARAAAINKEIILRTTSIASIRPTGNYFRVRVPAEEGEVADADGLIEVVLIGQYFSTKQLDLLIADKEKEIQTHQKANKMLTIFLAYETEFGLPSYSLMDEMEPYIKEASYKSDAIEDATELFNLGLKLIRKISRPKTQFSLNAVDFLSLVEASPAWYMVSLGAILKLKSSNLDFKKDALLLKYTHSPDSQSLNLEFSEDLTLDSDTKFIADLIAKSSTVSNQVSFNSSYWASGGAVGGTGGVVSNYFDMLYANEITTQKLVADEIIANNAIIGDLVAENITATSIITEAISANFAKLDFANINFALITNAVMDSLTTRILEADSVAARIVTTTILQAESASIRELFTDYLTTAQIDAQYANINLANIDIGVIKNVLATDLLATDGYIANLKVGDAEIVSLDAAKIIAGTISVEKILLRGTGPNGEQGLLLGLNNLGELVSTNVDSLDGYVLTNNTVHADKIIAESITAREIAANTITADKLLAGTITAASAAIASLDASKLTVGTLDASKVAIANLSATSIKTGLLESINGAFSLNMTTGDFNLGGVLIKNGDNVSIIAGGVPIEEYVDGKMLYLIKSNPEQIFINSTHDGDIEDSQSFSLDFSVYKGTALKAATITGVHLQDALGQVISTTGFSYSVIHPTEGGSGKLNLTFAAGTNLPVDTGYVQCLITVTENSKQFFYKISWSKVKAGTDGSGAVVISVWAPNGNVFKSVGGSTPAALTLQCDLYEGGASVNATAYLWSVQNGAAWDSLVTTPLGTTGATTKTLTVPASAVSSLENFRCQATYGGVNYYGVATLTDMTDPYQISIISLQGNTFLNGAGTTKTLKAIVFQGGVEVDIGGTELAYNWTKYVAGESQGSAVTGKTITVNASEVATEATYVCDITE